MIQKPVFIFSVTWCLHLVSWTFSRYFLEVRLALDDYQFLTLASHSLFSVMCISRHMIIHLFNTLIILHIFYITSKIYFML